jgi:hypothetical protein
MLSKQKSYEYILFKEGVSFLLCYNFFHFKLSFQILFLVWKNAQIGLFHYANPME